MRDANRFPCHLERAKIVGLPSEIRPIRLCHAVIVAGHAVLKNLADVYSDESWCLLDFQRGEPRFYIGHVRRGVELACADPSAVLILSGCQTRRKAGARSEGAGYYWLADHLGWFGSPEVRERAITEEFARDSFENVLLGICRFREFAGDWPEHVTMVSWAFKERRFDMHREAIRWPRDRYAYDGPNNPEDLAQAVASEEQARVRYAADPYSSSEFFQRKREDRNPFRLQHGYAVSCPEIKDLLAHEGPRVYAGPLPWDGK